MTEHDDLGLPPGLQDEYLRGARQQLEELAGLAARLAAHGRDSDAISRLRAESHKVHGTAGSFGFPAASRLAAGMEATVKDWQAHPNDLEVDRASTARWFVERLAALLGLPVPARPPPPPPSTRPSGARVALPPRVLAIPPRPSPRVAQPPAPPPPPPMPAPMPAPPAASPARDSGETAPGGTPEAELTVPELIYVEDDAALAELLEYGLRSRGYRFVGYRNGGEALAALLALDLHGTHPLLLLDVDLPALDGYSIFAALQRERPGAYRVVFTTVHGSEEEQLRGLEAGALDYLVKPISLRVALEKIKRWVGR